MGKIGKTSLRGAIAALFIIFLPTAGFSNLEVLPLPKLRKFKKEKCALIHPWADWCSICVQEMPTLLPQLEKWKAGRVVVVDTGSVFAQQNFSKKWNVLLNSKLT